METPASRRAGCGLDEGVQTGPVSSQESKARIEDVIERGKREGAEDWGDGGNM